MTRLSAILTIIAWAIISGAISVAVFANWVDGDAGKNKKGGQHHDRVQLYNSVQSRR